MTETNPQTTPTTPVVEAKVEKPHRVRTFFATHPRLTKAAKLTAAGVALVGVTRGVTNAQHNKAKLAEARDHAAEALDAATDAVVATDTEA